MNFQFQFWINIIIIIIEANLSYNSHVSAYTLTGNSIKNNINDQVDPCDDFYKYACGKWIVNNPSPPRDSWTIHEILQENAINRIIDILNDDMDTINATEALRKAKKMYDNCMNLDAINKDGIQLILSVLNKTGGFPAIIPLNDWTPNEQILNDMHEFYTKQLNLPLFYNIKVMSNEENATVNTLGIEPLMNTRLTNIHALCDPDPEGHLDCIDINKGTWKYIEEITEIVMMLANMTNSSVSREQVMDDVQKLVFFELDLIRFEGLAGLWRPSMINIEFLQEMHDIYSKTNNSKILWIDFLKKLFNGTGVNVTKNDKVLLHLSFMHHVIDILDVTPVRTIVNYIQWHFIEQMLHATPELLRSKLSGLDNLERNHDRKREKICVESVGLTDAIHEEYRKRYYSDENEKVAKKIINEILNGAYKTLIETPWLNSHKQIEMAQKMYRITSFTGYENWNYKSSEDNYRKLTINDNYMKNIFEARQFEMQQQLSKLKQQRVAWDSIDFKKPSITYHPSNYLVIPALMLPEAMSNTDNFNILQYGQFGAIIGSSISHVWDSEYPNFLKELKTNEYFHSKQCFSEEQKNWKFDGIRDTKIDGYIQTIDPKKLLEIIGDSNGLKFAYKAYQQLQISPNRNSTIPGLEEYTNDQTFFLSFANMWCANENDYDLRSRVDDYNPPKRRMLSSLIHMKEFAEAFNCPVDSLMNPQTKCTILGANN